MKKPTDLDLIDHYLERNTPQQRRQLDEAFDSSPDLRRRYGELAALWQLLGEAETGIPDHDLWPDLAERLAAPASRLVEQNHPVPKSWWAAASAAVVAAALVGYGSAEIRLNHPSETPTVAVNESDVINQLQLTAFESGPVQQLGQNLLEDDTQGST